MSAGRRIELLTIDLDGTLVDTATEIAEIANRSIEEFGLPRWSVATITRLIGYSDIVLAAFGLSNAFDLLVGGIRWR